MLSSCSITEQAKCQKGAFWEPRWPGWLDGAVAGAPRGARGPPRPGLRPSSPLPAAPANGSVTPESFKHTISCLK